MVRNFVFGSVVRRTVLGVCALGAVTFAGCGASQPAATTAQSQSTGEASGGEHAGWWCGEHGVPEEECAQCDKTLVAKFKEAGDWCEKHNRPESQCFICNPENFEKFAARYEAKFGKKPEMPKE
ncbi:MAG: RND transporter [Pirellulales bacterium]